MLNKHDRHSCKREWGVKRFVVVDLKVLLTQKKAIARAAIATLATLTFITPAPLFGATGTVEELVAEAVA